MIDISLWMLTYHFVGDFLLQSDEMAVKKSKSFRWLALHVFIYSICFLYYGVAFMVITFVLHFVQDAITSRVNGKFWFIELQPRELPKWVGDGPGVYPFFARIIPGKRHWFFVGIGADQLLHFFLLAWTARWLGIA